MSALDVLDAATRAGLPRESLPDWRAPALATLTDDRFSDPDWIYERKFDGERVVAFVCDGAARLMSRNRKDIGAAYPEVVEALAEACPNCVLDGEIVAFEGRVTSFSRLQARMQIRDPAEARESGVAVYYYLFDILHLEGRDLRPLALRRRKEVLKRALSFGDPLRFTSHRNRDGRAAFLDACTSGWEGLIAKRADAPYPDGRSRAWLKFKCAKGQELVIGGFTEPEGSREGFGALLLGYYRDGAFCYAGKVGTGFDDATLRELRARLDGLERPEPPFAGDVGEAAHWVEPELVADIGFTEWTDAGRLRHPRFLGLRRDKAAREVVREEAS